MQNKAKTASNETFVRALQSKNGLSEKDAKEVLLTILNTMRTELVKGNNVRLNNFVILKRVVRDERIGRNPKTNERVVIPKHYAVSVTVTKRLKDLLNRREVK